MKTNSALLIILTATCTSVAFGQSAAPSDGSSRQISTQKTTTEVVVTDRNTLPDALVMSGGAVVAVRGKETTRLETDYKLPDGTIVTTGGTVRRPDGTTTSLSDGQRISMAGNITGGTKKTDASGNPAAVNPPGTPAAGLPTPATPAK